MRIDSDSLVVITQKQARLLDMARVEMKFDKEIISTLEGRLKEGDYLIGRQKLLIDEQDRQIVDYKKLSTINNTLILNKDKEIETLGSRLQKRGATVRILGIGLTVTTSIILVGLLSR